MPDLRVVLREATELLRAAGVAAPRVDAELLAGYVLGVPRGRLPLARLDPPALSRYRELVRARAGRTPLQYLTGTAPFRRLEIPVGPGVFIPRPETELLVEWGLEFLRASAADRPQGARAEEAGAEEAGAEEARRPLVVDLCSGSGAIALAVADEYPAARVVAVEELAVEALRANVAALGLPVAVRAGDVTEPAVTSDLDGTVALVLCNPPYVPAGTPVPVEVAEHDPAVAVFGGADGLAVIRPVIGRAARLLAPGGGLGIEHDDSHGTVVPELLRADGAFEDVQLHRDLAGRPRFSTARRR